MGEADAEAPWRDPSIADCPIYEPGRPIEEVARAHGLDPAGIVKLASNENPLGPSLRAVEAIRGGLDRLHDYPDGSARELREALAGHLGLDPGEVVVGNGSNEVLEMIALAYLRPGYNAVLGQYSFVVYRLATRHAKAETRMVPMPDLRHDLAAYREAIDENTRVVFLASPDNPTGDSVDPGALLAFVEDLPPQVLFVLDEAYAEYLTDPVDLRPLLRAGRRIFCVRTFSKVYGLAGIRVGYGYGPASVVASLERVRQPFNLGIPAQRAARAALGDPDHVEATVRLNREGLAFLTRELRALGLAVRAGEANFVLVEVPSARDCFEDLQRQGVIVRPLDGYGLPRHLRVSTGTPGQNRQLVEAFRTWLENGAGAADP
jgi:histidinol-phosphate aminotransferase